MDKAVRNKTFIIISVLLLYLSSLALPVFYTEIYYRSTRDVANTSTWYGVQVLFLGWAAVLQGTIAWIANIIMPISIILYMIGSEKGYIFSTVGLFIAFTSIFYGKIWNEGDPEYIVSHGVGFYLWILSFVLIFLASIYEKK